MDDKRPKKDDVPTHDISWDCREIESLKIPYYLEYIIIWLPIYSVLRIVTDAPETEGYLRSWCKGRCNYMTLWMKLDDDNLPIEYHHYILSTKKVNTEDLGNIMGIPFPNDIMDIDNLGDLISAINEMFSVPEPA